MAKKILISSNFSKMASGFGKNARILLSYLYSSKNEDGSKKWECIEMAQGIKEGDIRLKGMPWKCYGGIPADESFLIGQPKNEQGYDPNLGRMVGYGAAALEDILKKEKPWANLIIEDPWAFNVLRKFSNRPYLPYWDAEWFNKTNSILWSPLDSLPLYESIVENMGKIKHFFVKSSFAQKELHRLGHEHVGLWPCLMDIKEFRVFSDEEKKETKKKYGIDEDCLIFGVLSRNQGRKLFIECIEGFSLFKKKNPDVKTKFIFGTNFAEGWDIKKGIRNSGLDPNDVLCTHVCHSCDSMVIKAIEGTESDCPKCGTQKSLRNISVEKGISEKNLVEYYNILNGYIGAFTSGGYELTLAESAFAAVPTSTIDYSFGEMFHESQVVYSLKYTFGTEMGSLFKKANVLPSSICDFMQEVNDNPEIWRQNGLRFREWAMNTIHPDITLKKIEEFLESLPDQHYNFDFRVEYPFSEAPFSTKLDEKEWITETYFLFFGVTLVEDDKNFIAMKAELAGGATRNDVYLKCREIAQNELRRRGQGQEDLEKYFKQNGKKRLLYEMAGDWGDSLISLAVLEELRKLYPAEKWNIYVSALPQYREVYQHLDFIDGFIPWIDNKLFERWEGCRGQKKIVDVWIAPQIDRNYIRNGEDKNMFHPNLSLTSQ